MAKTIASTEAKKEKNEVQKKKKALFPARKKNQVHRLRAGIDWPFALLLMVLLTIGTIFVFSSSYVYANHKFGNSYYFINRQLISLFVSIFAMLFTVKWMDYLILKKFAGPIFIVAYALLWLVFAFGSDANGARRWIGFGSLSFQPSEVMKFAVILLIASYIVWLETKGQDLIRTLKYGVLPFALIGIIVAIPLILQPHLSATIIILVLIFSMMYLAGVRKGILISAVLLVGLAMVGIILFTSHGQARIDAWFHPEENIQTTGWQPLQSLYAIGSGGLWGVGLGASKQKHLYLPEPQNDYIFAIICEEMGFVFAVAVIILFVLLIWRGFHIAKNAPSKFSSLLVMGIVCQVGIQVFLNIGVVSGALPSTGVSLPFFSYGGTSLVLLMVEMGVVLNVSKFSYIEKS